MDNQGKQCFEDNLGVQCSAPIHSEREHMEQMEHMGFDHCFAPKAAMIEHSSMMHRPVDRGSVIRGSVIRGSVPGRRHYL